jgi:hypothetical protein
VCFTIAYGDGDEDTAVYSDKDGDIELLSGSVKAAGAEVGLHEQA